MEFPFTQKVDDYEMKKKNFLSLAEGPRLTSAAVLGYQVNVDKEEKREFEYRMKLIRENIIAIHTTSKNETNKNDMNNYPINFGQRINNQEEATENYGGQYEYNTNSNNNNISKKGFYFSNFPQNSNNFNGVNSNATSNSNIAITHTTNSSIENNQITFNDLQTDNNPTTTNMYKAYNTNSNFNQFAQNGVFQIQSNLFNKNNSINYNIPSNPNSKFDYLNESSISSNSSLYNSSFMTQHSSNQWCSQEKGLRPQNERKKGAKKSKKSTQSKHLLKNSIEEISNDNIICFEDDDVQTNNTKKKNLNESNLNNSENISGDDNQSDFRYCYFKSLESICVDSIANKVFNQYSQITQYDWSPKCEQIIFKDRLYSKFYLAMKFSFCHSESKTHIIYFYPNMKETFDSIKMRKIYEVYPKRIYQIIVGDHGFVGIYIYLGFKFQ